MFDIEQKPKGKRGGARHTTHGPYEESRPIHYETIKKIVEKITDPLDKWLILCTYGNGNRINETCTLKFGDFIWEKDDLRIYSIVLKKRKKKDQRRNLPISRKLEPWITEPIIEYIAEKNQTNPNDKVWPYTTQTARNRFYEYFGTKPHNFRHSRATHLAMIHHFNTRELADAFCLSEQGLGQWVAKYAHLEKSTLALKNRELEKTIAEIKPVEPVPKKQDSPFFD